MKRNDYDGVSRFAKWLMPVFFLTLATSSISYAQIQMTELVRRIDTYEWSPPIQIPYGLAYFPPSNALLVSEPTNSQDWNFEGVNLWETTLSGSQVREYDISFSIKPNGVAYNPDNGHLFFSDDTGTPSVYELDPGPDALYGTSDDIVTSFPTSVFSCDRPEGIAYDTWEGHLFIAHGALWDSKVFEVDPGANGLFDGVDDVATHFDTGVYYLYEANGVEFNPDTGNLFIVGEADESARVIETTRDGTLVNEINVSGVYSRLEGVTYGPGSLNPSEKNLYISDEAYLYEFRLGETLPTPTLSISDVTVIEGDAGTVDAVFTVTISDVSSRRVIFDYITSDSTALAGWDYTLTRGTLDIPSGSTSVTITVPIADDAFEEPSEVFKLQLIRAFNGTIADGLGLGTIIDDDDSGGEPVTVSFQNGVNGYKGMRDAVLKASSPTTNFGGHLEGELDGTPDESTLLFWDVAGISIGSLVESVDITVNVTNTSGATYEIYDLKRAWVERDVTWNESSLGQSWEVAGADGSQDRGSTVLGAFTAPNTGPTTISLNAEGVAAVQAWVDDPSSNHGFIVQDYINHSNGLDFSSREAPTVSNRPMLTVTYEVSGSGTPALSIGDAAVAEGNSGTVEATFTVTLSPASTETVTVDYSTADGMATTAGNDYNPASGSLSFAPGETSQQITVQVNGDTAEEGDETFTVDLSNPVGATIADDEGAGTITNDDSGGGQPTVASFQDGAGGYTGTRDAVLQADSPATNYGSHPEGELDGEPDKSTLLFWDVTAIPIGSLVESVDITVNVTNTSGATYEIYDVKRAWVESQVTWNESTSGQSWEAAGAAGSQDRGSTVFGAFTAPNMGPTTISLNAEGVAAVQAWVDDPSSNHGFIVQDYINHRNGLNFSSREAPTVSNRPMLTVTYGGSGSGLPALSIDDVSVTEGNSGTVDATFTVTLSPASTETVTVDYETADGTATAGSDYVAASGQVSFQPGETSQSVTVVVHGDTAEENDETFLVNLTGAAGAAIGSGQGTGTIANDDASVPVTVSFQDGTGGYSGTRDVELADNLPTTNFGGDTVLKLDGTPSRSVLLSWNLSSIPVGSPVTSAEITFNITNATDDTYEFYEALRPWVEGEATWNEYATGQSWQEAGAAGSSDRGSAVLGSITGPKGLTTVQLNAAGVAVVKSWVDDNASNHGLAILNHAGADNELDLSSRENTSDWKRPKLTVTYLSSGGASTAKPAEPELAIQNLPQELALHPSYPNPFRYEMMVAYALPEQASVRLKVYNIRGRLVRTLLEGPQEAGNKQVRWDGTDDAGRAVGSGVYLLRLMVDQQQFTGKMVLMK